jgi:hypothetical protein
VPLTFDLGPDHVDLVAIGGSGTQESNPVAVTHPASIHLCYLVVTAEAMSNLQSKKRLCSSFVPCFSKRSAQNYWQIGLFHKRIFLHYCHSFTSRFIQVSNLVPLPAAAVLRKKIVHKNKALWSKVIAENVA